jgi:uncharacterized membrane protein
MKNKKIRNLVYGATIAALYVVLTYLSSLLGLSSGAVQLRFSEALVILPVFMPCAVPGLFVGCLIANLLSGGVIIDVIFGSVATLLGALGTRFFRKKPILALFPPIIANTLIVPPVIYFVYGSELALPFIFLGVFVGEAISCGIFGYVLYNALKNKSIFN